MGMIQLLAEGELSLDDIVDSINFSDMTGVEEVVKNLLGKGIRIETKDNDAIKDRFDIDYEMVDGAVDIDDVTSLHIREVKDYPKLNDEEEREALQDKSMDKISRNHADMVVSIAKRYRDIGVPMMDLIQEGHVGLLVAMQKYDPRRGAFAPYAAWWVRNHIARVVHNEGRTIRIPVSMREKILRYRKVQADLYQALAREPNIEEIASEMGITPKKVSEAMQADSHIGSLDKGFGGGSDSEDEGSPSSLMSVIADENAPKTDAIAVEGHDAEWVDEMMDYLDIVEKYDVTEYEMVFGGAVGEKRKFIELLYGIGETNGEWSHEEVAQYFDVEVDYVYKEERKALRQLRSEFAADAPSFVEKRFKALSEARQPINYREVF